MANGNIRVEQGSNLRLNSFSFGTSAGLTGTGIVTDTNSRLNAGSSSSVGDSGNGELRIENGAFLRANPLNIGTNAGSNGLLIVKDAGSLAQDNASPFLIGRQGTGELRVENSGSVNFRDVEISVVSGSLGCGCLSSWIYRRI